MSLLALASCPEFAGPETNSAALASLPKFALNAGDLLIYASVVAKHRGWGRGLRSAIADWYLSRPIRQLAHEAVCYPEHDGWTHGDLLRLTHPKPANADQQALFQWMADGELGHWAPKNPDTSDLRHLVAYERMKRASSEWEAVAVMEQFRLPWDMIPSEWAASPRVWESLTFDLSYDAVLQNLVRLASMGLLTPQSELAALVTARILDRGRLTRAEVHPATVLETMDAYASNDPLWVIEDALETAFRMSLDNLPLLGTRVAVAIDDPTHRLAPRIRAIFDRMSPIEPCHQPVRVGIVLSNGGLPEVCDVRVAGFSASRIRAVLNYLQYTSDLAVATGA
jgi:60 kDa SS-A/Ro ribonucleoprotein